MQRASLASLHKDELMKNWERCQIQTSTTPIAPWSNYGYLVYCSIQAVVALSD